MLVEYIIFISNTKYYYSQSREIKILDKSLGSISVMPSTSYTSFGRLVLIFSLLNEDTADWKNCYREYSGSSIYFLFIHPSAKRWKWSQFFLASLISCIISPYRCGASLYWNLLLPTRLIILTIIVSDPRYLFLSFFFLKARSLLMIFNWISVLFFGF